MPLFLALRFLFNPVAFIYRRVYFGLSLGCLIFSVTFYNLGVSDNLKNDIGEVSCCISLSGLKPQYKARIFFADIY